MVTATDMRPKTLFWEWLIMLFGLNSWYLPTTGELYKTTKGYKAVEEDELTLEAGEMIEVIHKLLDGWWVVRYESASLNLTWWCFETIEILAVIWWVIIESDSQMSYTGKEKIRATTHLCSCAGRERGKRWMLRRMWSEEQHHHPEGRAICLWNATHKITITEHFGLS